MIYIKNSELQGLSYLEQFDEEPLGERKLLHAVQEGGLWQGVQRIPDVPPVLALGSGRRGHAVHPTPRQAVHATPRQTVVHPGARQTVHHSVVWLVVVSAGGGQAVHAVADLRTPPAAPVAPVLQPLSPAVHQVYLAGVVVGVCVVVECLSLQVPDHQEVHVVAQQLWQRVRHDLTVFKQLEITGNMIEITPYKDDE